MNKSSTVEKDQIQMFAEPRDKSEEKCHPINHNSSKKGKSLGCILYILLVVIEIMVLR